MTREGGVWIVSFKPLGLPIQSQCFLGTLKGLISQWKSAKSGFSILCKKMWRLFWSTNYCRVLAWISCDLLIQKQPSYMHHLTKIKHASDWNSKLLRKKFIPESHKVQKFQGIHPSNHNILSVNSLQYIDG